MFYTNWFESVGKLVFPESAAAPRLTEVQLRLLNFLGKMFIAQQTHIIRMRDCPKSFDRSSPQLGTRPELYTDKFFLPGEGVVVEDEHSAVGFVDLNPRGPREGLAVPRVFVYWCRTCTSRCCRSRITTRWSKGKNSGAICNALQVLDCVFNA